MSYTWYAALFFYEYHIFPLFIDCIHAEFRCAHQCVHIGSLDYIRVSVLML